MSLPCESRELLLAEIRHLDSAAGIVKAFTDVGASRPVTLSDEDSALLFELIEAWSRKVGVGTFPRGVWDLRCAIVGGLPT